LEEYVDGQVIIAKGERACSFIADFHKPAKTDKIAPAGFCPTIANRTQKGVKTCILTIYAV